MDGRIAECPVLQWGSTSRSPDGRGTQLRHSCSVKDSALDARGLPDGGAATTGACERDGRHRSASPPAAKSRASRQERRREPSGHHQYGVDALLATGWGRRARARNHIAVIFRNRQKASQHLAKSGHNLASRQPFCRIADSEHRLDLVFRKSALSLTGLSDWRRPASRPGSPPRLCIPGCPAAWRGLGIAAGETTWRESEGWPHRITTDRATVAEADSVGVELAKGAQLGSIVLFVGGWADFMFWNGVDDSISIMEAPGWNDPLDVGRFGQLLDRLADLFR
ncbi:hypothetical protein ACWEHA_18795 [Amycolatopsis nivea]